MSCSTPSGDPDFCPDIDAVLAELLTLLPRGRAWGAGLSGPQPGSVLWRFWRAVASVFADLEARICALREEFWCISMSETRDLWLAEYGLPDACDPFPDICAKVAAHGGSNCDYFAAVAAWAGWLITCSELTGSCGASVGYDMAGAGFAAATSHPAVLVISVDLWHSPAVSALLQTDPMAGLMETGNTLACPVSLSPLQCLMDRIVPAHVQVVYLT